MQETCAEPAGHPQGPRPTKATWGETLQSLSTLFYPTNALSTQIVGRMSTGLWFVVSYSSSQGSSSLGIDIEYQNTKFPIFYVKFYVSFPFVGGRERTNKDEQI